ncbi:ACC synthase [Canna indica]|uniref:ACC synthase n=1 Tax=Canna indica TaxID=4628 RepID=A0AAQ3KQ86_9LILI|nr:ACC synthase [Canna indica]
MKAQASQLQRLPNHQNRPRESLLTCAKAPPQSERSVDINPSNPLGMTTIHHELNIILDFVIAKNIHLISDEICSNTTFVTSGFISVMEALKGRNEGSISYQCMSFTASPRVAQSTPTIVSWWRQRPKCPTSSSSPCRHSTFSRLCSTTRSSPKTTLRRTRSGSSDDMIGSLWDWRASTSSA